MFLSRYSLIWIFYWVIFCMQLFPSEYRACVRPSRVTPYTFSINLNMHDGLCTNFTRVRMFKEAFIQMVLSPWSSVKLRQAFKFPGYAKEKRRTKREVVKESIILYSCNRRLVLGEIWKAFALQRRAFTTVCILNHVFVVVFCT